MFSSSILKKIWTHAAHLLFLIFTGFQKISYHLSISTYHLLNNMAPFYIHVRDLLILYIPHLVGYVHLLKIFFLLRSLLHSVAMAISISLKSTYSKLQSAKTNNLVKISHRPDWGKSIWKLIENIRYNPILHGLFFIVSLAGGR